MKKDTRGVDEDLTTRFLNVDLDLVSKADLTPLVAALAPKAFSLHADWVGRKFVATFEVSSRRASSGAEGTVLELVRILKALRGTPRRLFREASSRTLDIGIGAGREPHSFQVALSPAAIAAVGALDIAIAVTVYAPYPRPKRRSG